MSDKVLVTGAAGFVGGHLIEELVSRGNQVVATDIKDGDEFSIESEQLEYIRGDITDAEFVSELCQDTYDRAFHLASVVGVEDYVEDPLGLMEVNVVSTKRLLEEFSGTDTRFVFTSTSEVYGKNPDVPWSEEDDRVLGSTTVNRWSYSTSKSACEHMLTALARTGEIDVTIVRPFNLYGPRQRPDFVIPAFLKAVVNDEVPTVYDDGTQTRCFTYIDDFIDGIIKASNSENGANEIFNLGNTRETQIKDLAETVLEIAGMDERNPEHIDTDELYGERYEDLDRRVPDVSKAKELLEWEAETSLEEGLEETLEWAYNNY